MVIKNLCNDFWRVPVRQSHLSAAYRWMTLEILNPGMRLLKGEENLFQWARQAFNIRKRSKVSVYILFCGATRQFPDSRVIDHIIDNGSAAEYKLLMEVTGRRHTHSGDIYDTVRGVYLPNA